MIRYDWNGQSRADEYVSTFEEVRIYINGQSIGRLSGSAPRLFIELIDGQSLLDLSGFHTSEIVAVGKIDGQSSVFMRSAGNIALGQKVDGQSLVVLCAGGGIVFGEINGQSRVLYYSMGPVVGPVLNGRSTVLWQGQAPSFVKVDGQSSVVAIPPILTFNCFWDGLRSASHHPQLLRTEEERTRELQTDERSSPVLERREVAEAEENETEVEPPHEDFDAPPSPVDVAQPVSEEPDLATDEDRPIQEPGARSQEPGAGQREYLI